MRHWIYIALVFTVISVAHGAEKTRSGSITLNQVIVNVLERNPQLGANDFVALAFAAKIRQAQQNSPLEIKLDLENFAGTGDYAVVDRIETTLSVVKVLELGNKVSLRSELAQRQASLLRDEQDSIRLDVLADATERFMHVVIDQHRLKIAQQRVTLAQHTHEVVTQRVNAGKSHAAEQRQTSIALSRAELDLEHAEHELSASRLKLSVTWGETRVSFGSAEAELFFLTPVASFEKLELQLVNNPDLVRFATEERLAQSRVRLSQSRRQPNVEISGGVRYFGSSDDAALMVSASLPLGARSRAKPEIEEMQSLVQREPLRYEQMRLTLISNLYEVYQELLHARTAYETLTQHIIPQAEQAAADYEQGYKHGRFSLLELNDAQQVLLSAQLERIMAAANYHRFYIEIERLTGIDVRSGVSHD